MDYGPLPPCQIPPVIHSVYVPNKPRVRTNTNSNLAQVDTHLELIQRQHSYNAVDYDLQRRIKIQQQARSQLLQENPSFSRLLDEQGKPISTMVSPVPKATSIQLDNTNNSPKQSTTLPFTPSLYSGNETPTDIDQHRQTQQPQRRAFGEMMRDGAFMSQRQGPGAPNASADPTSAVANNEKPSIPQPAANLHNTELSNSDSFVMIDDHDDNKAAKNHKTSTQKNSTTKEKGVTTNKHGLKLYDNKKSPTGSNHKQLLCSNVLHTNHGVDLLLSEPGHDVGLMAVDVIKYLQRGISVIKHGRRGKPHTCLLKLSTNCRYFTWDSKNKDDGENVVRFGWITNIEQGQSSAVFQRNADSRIETHSVSISYTRPEKYNHVDDSDDETEGNGGKTNTPSFLPSFFKRTGDTPNTLAGKRSTWKGTNQDHTLDIVIEDPNDWLIWYNGTKMLTDMASNKAISDRSVRLTKKTTITLQLPILSDYPSSSWIVDHSSGLTVAEQQENERHREQNQVQVQVALTRKETFKELVRRSSSYNAGSQSNIRDYLANQTQLQRKGSTTSLYQPPSPLNTDSLSQQQQIQSEELDMLAQSFPSPWKSIEINSPSDIVHPSWLQQLVYYGPKAGRSCPWIRAYTMSTTAAVYSRIIDRIKYAPLEELGIVPEKIDPDLSTHEIARRQRAYQMWYNQAGSLSIMILRTKAGDVIGGFATSPWVEKWGFYGSPDSFVFSIGQEHVTLDTPAVEHTDSANADSTSLIPLEEKIYQAHVYRWCGLGRFFQFISRDAIGFGSNPTDENPDPNSNQSLEEPNAEPNTNGQKPIQLSAPQTTGPALTLDKSFETGYSLPCPIFHSPQLTKEKQFKCLQLEIWIPMPKI